MVLPENRRQLKHSGKIPTFFKKNLWTLLDFNLKWHTKKGLAKY